MDEDKDFAAGVLKTALGVALGGLLLWGAMHLYFRYTTRVLLDETSRALEQIGENARRQSQRLRLQQQQRREEEEARRQHALMQKAQADAAAAAATRKALDAERRTEEAWERFYQPSPECLETSSVECGNAYIRARRQFEQSYTAE